jgi:hypothetical protein
MIFGKTIIAETNSINTEIKATTILVSEKYVF